MKYLFQFSKISAKLFLAILYLIQSRMLNSNNLKTYHIKLIALYLSLVHCNNLSSNPVFQRWDNYSAIHFKYKTQITKDYNSGDRFFKGSIITKSTTSDSGIGKQSPKFYLSTDLNGYFASYIYKDYNPDAVVLRGYIALMPLYRLGKVTVGIGGAIEKQYYQQKAFQAGSNRTIKSLGFAMNYTYGNKPNIRFTIASRMYYNFLERTLTFNPPKNKQKDEAISFLIGWGPSFKFRRFQLTPIANLHGITRNYYTNSNSDLRVQSGLLLNLTFNFKK